MNTDKYTLEARSGDRLDRFLAGELNDISRSQIQQLIKAGNVTVDGKIAKASLQLLGGETISILVPRPQPLVLNPEKIPLDVVYRDDDVIVVNKAAGMVVHPATGHNSGTLANALLSLVPEIAPVGPPLRPGIVHRLDADTSGLIVIALNHEARLNLKEQFRSRTIKKTYIALTDGQVSPPEGMIDAPIGRSQHRRKRMAVIREGRPAVTVYQTLENFDAHTLLEVQLLTGRTHQIRVHLAFMGFPIVGDTVYGRRKATLSIRRQFLHAYRLSFAHPRTGRRIVTTAILPNDLQHFLRLLKCGWSGDPTGAILESE